MNEMKKLNKNTCALLWLACARTHTHTHTHQVHTCSVLHVLHLHHFGVDAAPEHVQGPTEGLGPLGGLLPRHPRSNQTHRVSFLWRGKGLLLPELLSAKTWAF